MNISTKDNFAEEALFVGYSSEWEAVSFLTSFSRNRRKPRGRERKGVSKAEREDMLFTGRTMNL